MNTIKISDIRCNTNAGIVIGKVKSKSKINAFKSGNGSLFSIDLADESSKIRMVFFNDLTHKHFKSIEFGKWYSLESFRVATSRHNTDTYEIHCTDDTKITPVDKEDTIEYFLIDQILKMNLNESINVIGICGYVKDASFGKKDGSGIINRKTIQIIDLNSNLITIQVFQEFFEAVQTMEIGSVAAFHNLQVTQYKNEKYLLFTANSSCNMNTDHECVAQLKEKLTQDVAEKSGMVYSTFSLHEAIEMFNGTSFEFNFEFKILDIDKSQIYKCCPTDTCQKKINTRDDGSYECLKCNKTYTNYAVHALIKILGDDNGKQNWLSSFHSSSLKLLDMASNQFAYLWEFDTTNLDSRINDLIGKSIKATGKISNNKTGQGFQISIIACEVNDKKEADVVPKNIDNLQKRKREKLTQNFPTTPVKNARKK